MIVVIFFVVALVVLIAVVARRSQRNVKKEAAEVAMFNASVDPFGNRAHTRSLRHGIQNPLHVLAQTGSTDVDKSDSYAEMLGEEATAKPEMLQRVYGGMRSIHKQDSYLVPTVVVHTTADPVYETPTDDAVPVYEYDEPTTAAADTNIYATPSEPSQGIGSYLAPLVDASTMNPAYETPTDDAGDADTYATCADPSMEVPYNDADDLSELSEATYASPAPEAFQENATITSPKAVPKQVFAFTNETETATSESTTDQTKPAYGISNPTYQVADRSSGACAEFAVASVFEGEHANIATYDSSAAPAALYDYGTAPETADQTYSMASAEAAIDAAGDALAAAESIDDDAYVSIGEPECELGREDSDPVYNCASDTPTRDPVYDAATATGDATTMQPYNRPTPSYDPSPLYDSTGVVYDTADEIGTLGADATFYYSTATLCVAVTPSGTDDTDTAPERQRPNPHAQAPIRTLTQL